MSKRKKRRGANKPKSSSIRFRLHPKASEVADRLGDHTSLQHLGAILDKASEVSHELRECRYFKMLDQEHIEHIGKYDTLEQAYVFWKQLNQLMILSARTASRAVASIIDGLSSAVASKNELTLALMSRALLEHAAALHTLEKLIFPSQKHLVKVWPNVSKEPITEQDKEIHKELLRFVVGRRVQIAGDAIPFINDSIEAWKKFNKSLDSVPEQFKSTQILTMIDTFSKHQGLHDLRTVYEILCEYCHPNSASRTLDFNVAMSSPGKHVLQADTQESLRNGFRIVYGLFKRIVSPSCEAINRAFSTLSACRQPMSPYSYELKDPPIMGTRVVDDFGRVGWVETSEIFPMPIFNPVPLTDEQRERIECIHSVFKSTLSISLSERLELMSWEGPNLEDELRLFEHFVVVFLDELKDRGSINLRQRKLLYVAIVKCVEASSLDDLLSILPQAKSLPNIERVFARMKSQY